MSPQIATLFALLLVCRLGLSQSFAETSVTAHVLGNISIVPTTSELYSVFLDNNHTGHVQGCLSFVVVANQTKVCLQVKATSLYNSDPSKSDSRLPLTEQGVTIVRTPYSGSIDSEIPLEWGSTSSLNRLPAKVTRIGVFKSVQPYSFHEEIAVHVSWDHSNQNLPPGVYEGHIKLTGFVLP